VKNREVNMQNSLDFPPKYKNIMIEGGSEFLNAIYAKVDWFLIFHSPYFELKGKKRVKLDLHLRTLYNSHINDDVFSWYKKL
jgi:riboflavin biosynthesis pyrimidine reductase